MGNEHIKSIEELEEVLTSRLNKYEATQERFIKLLEEKIDKISNVSELIPKMICLLQLEDQYMYCITDSGIEWRQLRSISMEDNELVYYFRGGVSTKRAFSKKVDAENYIKKLYGIEH